MNAYPKSLWAVMRHRGISIPQELIQAHAYYPGMERFQTPYHTILGIYEAHNAQEALKIHANQPDVGRLQTREDVHRVAGDQNQLGGTHQ